MHKLSRRELLQLLLTQGREAEKLRSTLEETQGQLEQMTESYERLKKRLDHKDEQIHSLRETLQKERTNRRIELDEAGSIAEAALRLNGIFEAAQKTAEQYLYNIRLLYDNKVAEYNGLKPEEDAPEELEDIFEDGPEEMPEKAAEATLESAEESGEDAVSEPVLETEAEAPEDTEPEPSEDTESEAPEGTIPEGFAEAQAEISAEDAPPQTQEGNGLEEVSLEAQKGKKSRKRIWRLGKRHSK